MDGILNVLKPPGMTSHDVVQWIRKNTKEKKVGHIGTLDPGAAGVLPIFLGKATKIIQFISEEKKTYRAKIVFGETTDTQDQFGQVLKKDNPNFTLSQLKEAFKVFTGEITQTPSIYSAIKVNGKKLYEYARQGESVEIPSRKINIYSIRLLDHNVPNYAFVEVVCSKGTYIRSLCADIGEYLGCGAHMGFLLRTSSGIFHVNNTFTLEEIAEKTQSEEGEDLLLPLDTPLYNYPKINIKDSALLSLKNGNKIYPQGIEEKITKIYTDTFVRAYKNNKLEAIGKVLYEIENQRYYFKPVRVL